MNQANILPRDPQTYEKEPVEEVLEQQPLGDIPSITIDDTDQKRTVTYESVSEESSTETEMSSHRSSHHNPSSSSSKGKGHSTSSSKHHKSKTDRDDWSDITDPEERRRVQNRIAQRKFREKAKEDKERKERDDENRTYAKHSYQTPNPEEMGADDELSGLPWGSFSLKHVVSKGRASDSRRDSRQDESHYGTHDQGGNTYGHGSTSYENHQPAYYEADEQHQYDYGSGSGSGYGGSSY